MRVKWIAFSIWMALLGFLTVATWTSPATIVADGSDPMPLCRNAKNPACLPPK